jgi:hypothetical protein
MRSAPLNFFFFVRLCTQDKHNIKVNCVVPVAGSRMTETVLPADMLKLLDPQHITPLVTYLAHESSEHTGSCFEVGGGWYSQVRTLLSGVVDLFRVDCVVLVALMAGCNNYAETVMYDLLL